MRKPLLKARWRPRLAPPSLAPLALGLLDALGPLYAKYALRLGSLEILGAERLIEALREFYGGQSRLILAFRHPYGDEPQLLSLALRRTLPRIAASLGSPLPRRPHCLFLHGYEVPLWSGSLVRWLLPRTGAMPVYHVRVDGKGLRTIRTALRDGEHPLALAPEGQSSYRSETLPRIELGSFQLGFWCAEELEAAGRPERVLVLPLGVHERHSEEELPRLERACARLERELGVAGDWVTVPKSAASAATSVTVPVSPVSAQDNGADRRQALGCRLRNLDRTLLAAAEAYYGRGTGTWGLASPAEASVTVPRAGDTEQERADRERRRAALIEEALRRGEAILGLKPEGDPINRVYRIRHEGWSRIYPESDPAALPTALRAMADRRASEAWHAMRHMEFVDLCWYLDAAYLEEGLGPAAAPSVGRLSETLHNLYDLASRLRGGNISDRPHLLERRIVLAAGEPLELRSRLPEYRADRRGALERAAAELSGSWVASKKEFLDGEHSD